MGRYPVKATQGAYQCGLEERMLFMFIDFINKILQTGASSRMTDKQFVELELNRWINSEKRKKMLTGEAYFEGKQAILHRQRTIIGVDGNKEVVSNLPNNKLVDNQYGKMVKQKANYLLGKPLVFESENNYYEELLKQIFTKDFMRKIKNGTVDGLNGGLFWLYVYVDDKGNLKFQRFPAYSVLPFWKDSEHTELDCAVRFYITEAYEGTVPTTVEHVEIFTSEGVKRYIRKNTMLIEDVDQPSESYLTDTDGNAYNWLKIPLVAFKFNDTEIPLIQRCKCLQDAYNEVYSDFMNNMQEDSRNSILILKNYDGEDLGTFRHNLAAYGVVKVKSVDGVEGGVDTLRIEVNAANYESILKALKKSIIENCMGYDAKDDRLGGNANQMNIKSVYNDIDLEANDTESEYQAAFEQLLFFVDSYFQAIGKGDFTKEPVTITFNRDMIMNESEVIDNLVKLGVKLSNETLVGQVPFVDDVQKELDRIKSEDETNDNYGFVKGD